MKPRPPSSSRRLSLQRPEDAPAHGEPAKGAPAQGASLPAWKAFLVQFKRESRATGGSFSGRIEHLSSGRRARFDSRDELLAALGELLDVIDEPEAPQ